MIKKTSSFLYWYGGVGAVRRWHPFFLIMGNEPFWALLGRLSRGGEGDYLWALLSRLSLSKPLLGRGLWVLLNFWRIGRYLILLVNRGAKSITVPANVSDAEILESV